MKFDRSATNDSLLFFFLRNQNDPGQATISGRRSESSDHVFVRTRFV